MKLLIVSLGLLPLFARPAGADSVTWGTIQRSIVAQGYFAVTDLDRCSEYEIDGVPYQDCPTDEQRIEYASTGIEPLIADVDFGNFGRHHGSQTVSFIKDRITWTGDAFAYSQARGAGSQWYSAGGLGISQLGVNGHLTRSTVLHLTGNLSIEGDSYDDDGARIRLTHIDAEFNERVMEWRVSCNSACSDMPRPLSVDQTHLLPSGQFYLEALVVAGGGYAWDRPRVHADLELSFAPVPEPASWMLVATFGFVPLAASWFLRRRKLANC